MLYAGDVSVILFPAFSVVRDSSPNQVKANIMLHSWCPRLPVRGQQRCKSGGVIMLFCCRAQK
jgi:hypothetical protein